MYLNCYSLTVTNNRPYSRVNIPWLITVDKAWKGSTICMFSDNKDVYSNLIADDERAYLLFVIDHLEPGHSKVFDILQESA